MKRKHLQYRSSLLIGLLSLSILSSCTHTRRELGMGGSGSKNNKNNDAESNNSNGNNSSNKWRERGIGAAVGAAVAIGINEGVRQVYNYFTQNNNGCPPGSSGTGSFGSERP